MYNIAPSSAGHNKSICNDLQIGACDYLHVASLPTHCFVMLPVPRVAMSQCVCVCLSRDRSISKYPQHMPMLCLYLGLCLSLTSALPALSTSSALALVSLDIRAGDANPGSLGVLQEAGGHTL